jgi:hypothetical protein
MRNKNKKKTSIVCHRLLNKKEKHYDKDKDKDKAKDKDKDKDKKTNNKNLYKEKRKECKSSSMDGLKKRYKIYKEYFLEKENNCTNRNKELNENENSGNNKIYDYFQKKYSNKNLNNNNNQQNKNNNNRTIYLAKKKSNTLLLGKNINVTKKIKSPEIKKKIHDLQHSSNSETFQEKRYRKKSSNLILQLPKIKKDNIPKNINLKTERNRKSLLPLSHIYEKNFRGKKGDISPKKTTTINIYNNKINNINNIILNDKKIKNHEKENKNSNKEEESETIKSSKYLENKELNLLDKEENEENNKLDKNNEKKDKKHFSEELINKNFSETQISNEITDKMDLSHNEDTSKIKKTKDKMLIRRLSVNYHNEL